MSYDERERRYHEYVEVKLPYFDEIVENGDTPWFWQPDKCQELAQSLGLPDLATDDEIRRALWMRRFQRPEPPEGMSQIKSIRSHQRGSADVRLGSESDHRRTDTLAA
ncbi:hypothetical protein ACQI4L_26235 [Mycolicibacterium litorale]|uniref:hypothetical protein n=1 Tax=Mycolicibacterium litorale TaxID=758802 RepID=UPI003CEB9C9B